LRRCSPPPAEVIADYRGVHAQNEFKAGRQNVLEMILRRPCSLEDIASGLGMHRNEVIKHIEELEARHLIEKRPSGSMLYYCGKRRAEAQQEYEPQARKNRKSTSRGSQTTI